MITPPTLPRTHTEIKSEPNERHRVWGGGDTRDQWMLKPTVTMTSRRTTPETAAYSAEPPGSQRTAGLAAEHKRPGQNGSGASVWLPGARSRDLPGEENKLAGAERNAILLSLFFLSL